MSRKERARKLCDALIQMWLLHHSREEASEIADRFLEEEVKQYRVFG